TGPSAAHRCACGIGRAGQVRSVGAGGERRRHGAGGGVGGRVGSREHADGGRFCVAERKCGKRFQAIADKLIVDGSPTSGLKTKFPAMITAVVESDNTSASREPRTRFR